MISSMKTLKLFTLAAAFLFPLSAWSATDSVPSDYSGDVPYVATPDNVVDKMLEMAKVGPKDFVVDLGSGDGRIVLKAAKEKGASGRGVEIHEGRVEYSKRAAKKLGVEDKATFKAEDIFKTKISDATVVTMYLLDSVNMKLRPRLLNELRPGTRIVSHAFDLGDWEPDDKVTLDTGETIYYWVVPAKAKGTWAVDTGNKDETIHVRIEQDFQNIKGNATINGESVPITSGEVKGHVITFKIDQGETEKQFTGRLRNNKLVGTLQ